MTERFRTAHWPMREHVSTLLMRVISTVLLLPVVLAFLLYGGYAWLALVLLAATLAGREFYSLLTLAGHQPQSALGVALIALFVLEGFWPSLALLRPLLALGMLSTLAVMMLRRGEGAVAGWAVTLAGAVYVGGMLAHLVALRQLPDGLWWLLLALGVVWAGDAGAYLVGATLGRHRLWPSVSPKKTWEGAAGGFVCSVLAGLAFLAISRHWAPETAVAQLGWLQGAGLGLVVGLLALLGDLIVSMFKRRAGAKDSGRLIPGHGGMLDRADSLLLAIPLVYYWAVLSV